MTSLSTKSLLIQPSPIWRMLLFGCSILLKVSQLLLSLLMFCPCNHRCYGTQSDVNGSGCRPRQATATLQVIVITSIIHSSTNDNNLVIFPLLKLFFYALTNVLNFVCPIMLLPLLQFLLLDMSDLQAMTASTSYIKILVLHQ